MSRYKQSLFLIINSRKEKMNAQTSETVTKGIIRQVENIPENDISLLEKARSYTIKTRIMIPGVVASISDMQKEIIDSAVENGNMIFEQKA